MDRMKHSGTPNIVVIAIDSLRADHVSSYGYEKKTTPHIDRIATDAILFDSAISPSSWTLPVFSSMLTGTYPSKHGMGQYVNKFPTIMGILRKHGYKSFGLTANPFLEVISPGFDEFSYLSRSTVAEMTMSDDPAAVFKLVALLWRHGSLLNARTIAKDFLKNRIATRMIDRNWRKGPFFMLIHYDVHWPYEPPDPFFSTFVDEPSKREVGDLRRDLYELIAEQGSLPRRTPVLKSLYDALIAWVDTCVGSLVEHLKISGVYDNTVLIITSDHGDLLGEHGLLFHEFGLYEPLIRVPLVIRYPDLYQKGKHHSGLVQTLDLFPTLIEYLGFDSNDSLRESQGKSLFDLVEGKDERTFAVSERADLDPRTPNGTRTMNYLERTYPNYEWRKFAHAIVALRTLDHKYIWSSEGRDELYDLRHDPEEMNNMISAETGKASELRNVLETWQHTFAPAQQTALEIELEGSVKEKLRKLGYI